ncbi:MAG: hypothetical protein HUJ68_03575 [Clostridia bacterium]|nr:hypothetical protein [Clostridia bacterium]
MTDKEKELSQELSETNALVFKLEKENQELKEKYKERCEYVNALLEHSYIVGKKLAIYEKHTIIQNFLYINVELTPEEMEILKGKDND